MTATTPYCPHCANLNSKSRFNAYPTNHWLRASQDPSSIVTCPELSKTECRWCAKTGHTIGHCAEFKEHERIEKKNAKNEERETRASYPRTVIVKSVVNTIKCSNAFAAAFASSDDEDDTKAAKKAEKKAEKKAAKEATEKADLWTRSLPAVSYATMVSKPEIVAPKPTAVSNLTVIPTTGLLTEEWSRVDMNTISTYNPNWRKQLANKSMSWADMSDSEDEDW